MKISTLDFTQTEKENDINLPQHFGLKAECLVYGFIQNLEEYGKDLLIKLDQVILENIFLTNIFLLWTDQQKLQTIGTKH